MHLGVGGGCGQQRHKGEQAQAENGVQAGHGGLLYCLSLINYCAGGSKPSSSSLNLSYLSAGMGNGTALRMARSSELSKYGWPLPWVIWMLVMFPSAAMLTATVTCRPRVSNPGGISQFSSTFWRMALMTPSSA